MGRREFQPDRSDPILGNVAKVSARVKLKAMRHR